MEIRDYKKNIVIICNVIVDMISLFKWLLNVFDRLWRSYWGRVVVVDLSSEKGFWVY